MSLEGSYTPLGANFKVKCKKLSKNKPNGHLYRIFLGTEPIDNVIKEIGVKPKLIKHTSDNIAYADMEFANKVEILEEQSAEDASDVKPKDGFKKIFKAAFQLDGGEYLRQEHVKGIIERILGVEIFRIHQVFADDIEQDVWAACSYESFPVTKQGIRFVPFCYIKQSKGFYQKAILLANQQLLKKRKRKNLKKTKKAKISRKRSTSKQPKKEEEVKAVKQAIAEEKERREEDKMPFGSSASQVLNPIEFVTHVINHATPKIDNHNNKQVTIEKDNDKIDTYCHSNQMATPKESNGSKRKRDTSRSPTTHYEMDFQHGTKKQVIEDGIPVALNHASNVDNRIMVELFKFLASPPKNSTQPTNTTHPHTQSSESNTTNESN